MIIILYYIILSDIRFPISEAVKGKSASGIFVYLFIQEGDMQT